MGKEKKSKFIKKFILILLVLFGISESTAIARDILESRIDYSKAHLDDYDSYGLDYVINDTIDSNVAEECISNNCAVASIIVYLNDKDEVVDTNVVFNVSESGDSAFKNEYYTNARHIKNFNDYTDFFHMLFFRDYYPLHQTIETLFDNINEYKFEVLIEDLEIGKMSIRTMESKINKATNHNSFAQYSLYTAPIEIFISDDEVRARSIHDMSVFSDYRSDKYKTVTFYDVFMPF